MAAVCECCKKIKGSGFIAGPRKKQKAKASQPEASVRADDFELGDPAWDLLADLPDLAEHMTEDILLEPIPEDLPFNETAYSRTEIRPQADSAEGRDPGASLVPQVPIYLSDLLPYAPHQNVQLAQVSLSDAEHIQHGL